MHLLPRSQLQVHQALGAMMEAMDVSISWEQYDGGSITSNFLTQLKKPTTLLLREVRSDLVGWAFDTMLLMKNVRPRVEEKLTDLFAARKAEHVAAFASLLAAPGTFDIADYPNHHTFCTGIVGGVVRCCARTETEPPLPRHVHPRADCHGAHAARGVRR